MPAFSVIEDVSGENRGNVYFAKSHIHARRAGANEFNDGEIGGMRVRRERGLDQYEASGNIPFWEMVNRGWWCDCCHCGETVNESLYDEEGRENDNPQGMFNSINFCSTRCMTEWERRKYVERGMAEIEYGRLRGKITQHFRDPIFAGERPKGYKWQGMHDRERFDSYYIGWLGSDNATFDWCNLWFRVPGVKEWALCRYMDHRGNIGGTTGISFPNGDVESYKPFMKKHLDRVLSDA